MTTITACSRRLVMCSDSQWSDGVQCGAVRKVHRLRAPVAGLYGFAGDVAGITAWLQAKADAAALAERMVELAGVTVLRLTAAGLATWTAQDGWFAIAEARWSIGSGSPYAIGAMAAGATPLEAVRVAIRHDAGTGGEPRTYRLSPRPHRRA